MSTDRVTSSRTLQKQLDELYKEYGFTKSSLSTPACTVYLHQSGYFHNAEMISFAPDFAPQALEDELRRSGFACAHRRFDSIDSAASRLFQGFFSIEPTRKRLQDEYARFRDRVQRSVGADYSYVPGRFSSSTPARASSTDLIAEIVALITSDRPTLVLMEAAAGFGKTCTAYEVQARVLEEQPARIPLVAELARNRQATIFRYVLLDEIDRYFPALRSSLVYRQISEGRIPLIVDGFDELLHRKVEGDENFDDAESMLATMSSLLSGRASVLLTTRRTAIFAGDRFHNWVDENRDAFDVVRIHLQRPTPEDWIGRDRVKALESCSVSGEQIANPVLLAFVRSLSDAAFQSLCDDSEQLVNRYIDAMLQREKERQNLPMHAREQFDVFVRLAGRMVDQDFTSEDREIIRELILEDNASLFSDVRGRYSAEERPTTDELSQKLAMHAFLDRRGTDDTQVGFVNDFVLGVMVGECAERDTGGEWIAPEVFIDAAVSAYSARSRERKEALWTSLKSVSDILDPDLQLHIDVNLTQSIRHDIHNHTFSDAEIKNIPIGQNHSIRDCVFSQCRFVGCRFYVRGLFRISFAGCEFYDCDVVCDDAGAANELYFAGCKSEPATFFDSMRSRDGRDPNPSYPTPERERYERAVLERFWPAGRSHWNERRALRTLYLGVGREFHEDITDAIERLRRHGVIKIDHSSAVLQVESLPEIRRILRREGES